MRGGILLLPRAILHFILGISSSPRADRQPHTRFPSTNAPYAERRPPDGVLCSGIEKRTPAARHYTPPRAFNVHDRSVSAFGCIGLLGRALPSTPNCVCMMCVSPMLSGYNLRNLRRRAFGCDRRTAERSEPPAVAGGPLPNGAADCNGPPATAGGSDPSVTVASERTSLKCWKCSGISDNFSEIGYIAYLPSQNARKTRRSSLC